MRRLDADEPGLDLLLRVSVVVEKVVGAVVARSGHDAGEPVDAAKGALVLALHSLALRQLLARQRAQQPPLAHGHPLGLRHRLHRLPGRGPLGRALRSGGVPDGGPLGRDGRPLGDALRGGGVLGGLAAGQDGVPGGRALGDLAVDKRLDALARHARLLVAVVVVDVAGAVVVRHGHPPAEPLADVPGVGPLVLGLDLLLQRELVARQQGEDHGHRLLLEPLEGRLAARGVGGAVGAPVRGGHGLGRLLLPPGAVAMHAPAARLAVEPDAAEVEPRAGEVALRAAEAAARLGQRRLGQQHGRLALRALLAAAAAAAALALLLLVARELAPAHVALERRAARQVRRHDAEERRGALGRRAELPALAAGAVRREPRHQRAQPRVAAARAAPRQLRLSHRREEKGGLGLGRSGSSRRSGGGSLRARLRLLSSRRSGGGSLRARLRLLVLEAERAGRQRREPHRLPFALVGRHAERAPVLALPTLRLVVDADLGVGGNRLERHDRQRARQRVRRLLAGDVPAVAGVGVPRVVGVRAERAPLVLERRLLAVAVDEEGAVDAADAPRGAHAARPAGDPEVVPALLLPLSRQHGPRVLADARPRRDGRARKEPQVGALGGRDVAQRRHRPKGRGGEQRLRLPRRLRRLVRLADPHRAILRRVWMPPPHGCRLRPAPRRQLRLMLRSQLLRTTPDRVSAQQAGPLRLEGTDRVEIDEAGLWLPGVVVGAVADPSHQELTPLLRVSHVEDAVDLKGEACVGLHGRWLLDRLLRLRRRRRLLLLLDHVQVKVRGDLLARRKAAAAWRNVFDAAVLAVHLLAPLNSFGVAADPPQVEDRPPPSEAAAGRPVVGGASR